MVKQLSLACLTLVFAGSVALLAQQPEDDINVLVTPPLEVATQPDTLPDLGPASKKQEVNLSPAPGSQESIQLVYSCPQPCCQGQRCESHRHGLFRRILAFLFGRGRCHS